ncbi:MAG: hypothetical protein ACKOBW_11190 [Planctomycetota bacterium]
MEFRRSGQSNQRRRRVLKEDPSASLEDGGTNPGKRRGKASLPGRSYSEAALEENQPHITELIPYRPWTLAICLLGSLLAGVVVEGAFAHQELIARWIPPLNIRVLDPREPGSLAAWLSSVFLLLSAVASLIIFSIRRFRTDDYHGRYRVWMRCAVLGLVASIDAATRLHDVPRSLFDVIITRLGRDATAATAQTAWCWLVMLGITAVTVRLVIEMRSSWGAMAGIVTAWCSYLLVTLLATGWMTISVDTVNVLLISSARLAGDLLVLGSLLVYSRYVYLDSQGLLAKRRAAKEAARRKRLAEKAARAEAKALAKEQKQAEREAARAARKSGDGDGDEGTAEDSSDDASSDKDSEGEDRDAEDEDAGGDDDEDAGDETDTRGMSRAERRRQKKLARGRAA